MSWGRRKDTNQPYKKTEKKGIKGASLRTSATADVHLKELEKQDKKIFEVELLTKGTDVIRGIKFIEDTSPEQIRKNRDEHVGENVEIGRIVLLPYKSLREASDKYNEEHGIEVVDGVRYYKEHEDCDMCKHHFSH